MPPRGKPSPTTRAVGATAESTAAQHLLRLGWRILARNHHLRRGELDLVALDGDTVSFVEVRMRKNADYGAPEETVGPIKQARLVRAAQHWLCTRGAAYADRACRFDVVAIEGTKLRVFRDAFRP